MSQEASKGAQSKMSVEAGGLRVGEGGGGEERRADSYTVECGPRGNKEGFIIAIDKDVWRAF